MGDLEQGKLQVDIVQFLNSLDGVDRATTTIPPVESSDGGSVTGRNEQEVRRGNIPLHLSPKEYKLLVYLVENAGRVIARTEIAEKVWETHFDTGTNFIDVYINYLRKKVDRDFDVKLIHTRPGMGFILTDKP